MIDRIKILNNKDIDSDDWVIGSKILFDKENEEFVLPQAVSRVDFPKIVHENPGIAFDLLIEFENGDNVTGSFSVVYFQDETIRDQNGKPSTGYQFATRLSPLGEWTYQPCKNN